MDDSLSSSYWSGKVSIRSNSECNERQIPYHSQIKPFQQHFENSFHLRLSQTLLNSEKNRLTSQTDSKLSLK